MIFNDKILKTKCWGGGTAFKGEMTIQNETLVRPGSCVVSLGNHPAALKFYEG